MHLLPWFTITCYNDFCSKGELCSLLIHTPTTLLSRFSSSHYKQSLEGHSAYHIKCSFWHPNSVVFLVVGNGNNSMSQGIHFPTFNSHSLPLILRETQRNQAKLGQSLGVQAMFPTCLTGRSGPSSLSEQCPHQSGQDRNQASHTHTIHFCALLLFYTSTLRPLNLKYIKLLAGRTLYSRTNETRARASQVNPKWGPVANITGVKPRDQRN